MEFNQTTRANIIENGVIFESSINQILCFILDINIEESIAFGHKSTLSFKQKVDILTDLKFVPKEIGTNFQTFSEIRNKFAHVHYIDSFTKYFEILSDKKNSLLKFYEKDENIQDEEYVYNFCFSYLCIQLSTWMRLILQKSHFDKSQTLKRTILVEMIRNLNTNNEIIHKNPSITNQIDKLINEIVIEDWFIDSINEAIQTGNKKTI